MPQPRHPSESFAGPPLPATEDATADTDAGRAAPREAGRLDLIACDDCGRSFATADGAAMLAAIKGPCPDCGGRFQLTASPS